MDSLILGIGSIVIVVRRQSILALSRQWQDIAPAPEYSGDVPTADDGVRDA
jgi:hypothetical protein